MPCLFVCGILLAGIVVAFIVQSLLLHGAASILKVPSDFNTAAAVVVRVIAVNLVIGIAASVTEALDPQTSAIVSYALSIIVAIYLSKTATTLAGARDCLCGWFGLRLARLW